MNIQKQELILHPQVDIAEFKIYLYEKENAEATIKKYVTDINTFVTFLQGGYQINKDKVLKYKEWLCGNYAASSVNSMLAALNQFLEFMGASMLKVKRLKIQKQLFLSEEKEMTKGECQKLIKTAYSRGNTQLGMAMETMAATGARISELRFFTIEQVGKGFITITNKGKQRTIVLPDQLKGKLLYYASKEGIKQGKIFVTRSGKAKDRSNLWREMKALKKASGVEERKIFPHNLRHLFARMFYRATKDLAGLADLLGHSSLDVTRIYTAVSGTVYKKQIERLGILME